MGLTTLVSWPRRPRYHSRRNWFTREPSLAKDARSRDAIALVKNTMHSGDTIRLDAGTCFASK